MLLVQVTMWSLMDQSMFDVVWGWLNNVDSSFRSSITWSSLPVIGLDRRLMGSRGVGDLMILACLAILVFVGMSSWFLLPRLDLGVLWGLSA